RYDVVNWYGCYHQPIDLKSFSRSDDFKFQRRAAAIHQRNLFKIGPYLIVEDETAQRPHHFRESVNCNGVLELSEGLGEEDGQRCNMITVCMGNYDITNGRHSLGGQGEPK